jgi:hypothetical protein
VADGKQEVILGDTLQDRVLRDRCVLFYGPDLSGKTALLKVLQKEIFSSTAIVPVKIEGAEISAQSEDAFLKKVWSGVTDQYSSECLEGFRQLPRERRALLIDNLDDSRLPLDKLLLLLESAKKHFSVIVASVRTILGTVDLYAPRKGNEADGGPLFQLFIIGEMRPSGRGKLIKKWLCLENDLASDPQALSKAIETEESTIDFLIGKKVLPSLPYLVVGILQARQRGQDSLADPGSFGYIVQRIVIDALSATKGRKSMIERKDYLLRTVAFYLFQHDQSQLSEREFETVVADFAKRKMINAKSKELLDDLLYGRILDLVDGQIQFKYEHFRYYFLALYFIDEIDGDDATNIRGYLNNMAGRPLVRPNRLTLIFFLFFKKKDPVIDRLIEQANATFADRSEAELLAREPDAPDDALAFVEASIDESIDVSVERERRWSEQDQAEQRAAEIQGNDGAGGDSTAVVASLDMTYEDATSDEQRWGFAEARLALLGQIVRNFPDSLEGPRKVQILEAAIRLGLRSLQTGLDLIHDWDGRIEGAIRHAVESEGIDADNILKAWRTLIGVLVRLGCNISILEISGAVGVQDLEDAYSTAIVKIGETPATRLVELAILLDHSKTFPFVEAQRLDRFLPVNAHLARAVMSDLIVRNTRRFDHSKEALRRIAGLIKVKPTSLLSGKTED